MKNITYQSDQNSMPKVHNQKQYYTYSTSFKLVFTNFMNYVTYQNNQNSMPKVHNQKQYFTKYSW